MAFKSKYLRSSNEKKNFFRKKNLVKNSYVGCDPELISISEWKEWTEILEQSDKQLVPVDKNLIDFIWEQQRPNLPDQPIWKHHLQYSGEFYIEYSSRKIFFQVYQSQTKLIKFVRKCRNIKSII